MVPGTLIPNLDMSRATSFAARLDIRFVHYLSSNANPRVRPPVVLSPEPDDSVQVTVLREGEEVELTVIPAGRDSDG